jgi:tetratricopeptide (TPR) repeat protein
MSDPELLQDGSNPQAEADASGSAVSAPTGRVRRSMFDDPKVRLMAWIAAGLVLIYLATILGALVMGVVGTTAPRTADERTLAVTEARYKSGERTAKGVAQYIEALIVLKKYSRAQAVIDASLKTVDQTRGGEITLSQAKLFFVKKQYQKAIDTAKEAQKIAKAKYDAEMKSTSTTESRAYGYPASYSDAFILTAQANEKLGNWKEAVVAYDGYLKIDATAADMLIARGYAKIKTGDKDGAKADFTTALQFIPDDARALEGLKQIGAGK